MKTLLLTSLLATTLLLTGCGTSTKEAHTDDDGHTDHVATGKKSAEVHTDNDGHTDHKKIGGDHDMHMTVDSEDGFLVDMIPHHQEAVDTSRVIVTKTENKQLKKLAQSIVDTQTKEIAMMQGLLASKYPTSAKKANYKNMMDPKLATLVGQDQEKSYLNGMIMHHTMAVDMAKQLLEITQEEQLVTFANAIISTQSKEIKDMKHIIEDFDRPVHAEDGSH